MQIILEFASPFGIFNCYCNILKIEKSAQLLILIKEILLIKIKLKKLERDKRKYLKNSNKRGIIEISFAWLHKKISKIKYFI